MSEAEAMAHKLARLAGGMLSPAGSRGRLTVFCFHQVLPKPDPLRTGEPDAAEFEMDVRLIDSVFNVLTFGEAARRLAEGSLPSRAACITFDDGYANNHEIAAPILSSHGVPATFFIAGGAVDQGVMWNDLVIDSIAHSDSDDDGGGLSSTLVDLKYRSVDERWSAAEQMYREAVGSEHPRVMMTRSQVASLAQQGFEIGGHTINHPILSAVSDGDAKEEIEACATWVTEVTGTRPTSFAYPNGIPGQDYESRHEEMVREAGFDAATSTEWAVARRGVNPFAIPRVGPWWRQGRDLTTGLCRGYLKSYL